MSKSTAELKTLEIPRNQWASFLAEFTRENRGAHGTLQVIANDVGDQIETNDRPFDGITADVKNGAQSIWITFGSTPDDHFAHGVYNVKAIRVIPATGNHGAVMELEGPDKVMTILTLTLPEAFALPPGEPRPGGPSRSR